MKQIVIVQKSSVSSYPPLLTFIECLNVLGYKVILICGNELDIQKQYLNSICDRCFYLDIPNGNSKLTKLFVWLKVRIKVWRLIYKLKLSNELFYFPTADTVLALGRNVLRLNYILNLYELFDTIPYYLKNIKQYALNANTIVCPDFTRAHIFKVWWSLKTLPYVIPNKPKERIVLEDIKLSSDLISILDSVSHKKIMLYQGIITPDRYLDSICVAASRLEDFCFIIVGKETPYLNQLKQINSNLIHISFIPPPLHLKITSYARIGILSYDHSSLNNIFCAPNKIWEFASLGIPMIGNNIPGLINSITNNNLGVCVDYDDVEQIVSAIKYIDQNHQYIST